MIIVSDDSSSSEEQLLTQEVVEAFGASYRVGPKRGVCANRNNALPNTDVISHIVFTDDDYTLNTSFIENALYHIQSMDQSEVSKSILAGRDVQFDGTTSGLYEMAFGAYYRPADLPRIVSCRSAVYPSTFFRIARFNEDIYFGYEDADLSFQAKKYGFRFVDCDDLRVEDHAAGHGVLNIGQSGKPSEASLWLASAKMHVGLKRYIFYSVRPDLLLFFFFYINIYLVKQAIKYRSIRYIFWYTGEQI
jgi:GT2 family glycosyltransferase